MALVSLVYFSEHRLDERGRGMNQQLQEILVTAKRKNMARGITGALVFDSRYFIQVLEGEMDVVWSTFNTLERDDRHFNVTFVEMEVVPERYFGNWAMGWGERSRETEATFAPYLRGGRLLPASMTGTELVSLLVDLRRSMISPGDFAQAG